MICPERDAALRLGASFVILFSSFLASSLVSFGAFERLRLCVLSPRGPLFAIGAKLPVWPHLCRIQGSNYSALVLVYGLVACRFCRNRCRAPRLDRRRQSSTGK